MARSQSGYVACSLNTHPRRRPGSRLCAKGLGALRALLSEGDWTPAFAGDAYTECTLPLWVWLTMVSVPSCGTASGSLKVSVVSRGRSAGVTSLWHSAARRRRVIWRVEATLDTSISNSCSIASIQRSRGDGVTSPVCACLCRVMGWIITPAQGPVESGGRYPPSFWAKVLVLRGKFSGRPANSIALYPSFSTSRL